MVGVAGLAADRGMAVVPGSVVLRSRLLTGRGVGGGILGSWRVAVRGDNGAGRVDGGVERDDVCREGGVVARRPAGRGGVRATGAGLRRGQRGTPRGVDAGAEVLSRSGIHPR